MRPAPQQHLARCNLWTASRWPSSVGLPVAAAVGRRTLSLSQARGIMGCLPAHGCSPRWMEPWALASSLRCFASGRRDPYEVLGVPRAATQLEIKRAYLQEAKKVHPDINSSPDATKRFQALAEAYQVLGNPETRAHFDRHGAGPSEQGFASGSGARRSARPEPADDADHEPVDAGRLFRAVMEELGAEQVIEYMKTVQSDAAEAAKKAQEGDLQPAKDFALRHKTLAAMVILPAFALLRFPGLVAAALRLLVAGGLLLMQAILRDPHLQRLVGRYAWYSWQMLIQRAKARARAKKP